MHLLTTDIGPIDLFRYNKKRLGEALFLGNAVFAFINHISFQKKYDEAMACCLMLSKRKEKDVRKFQLIYGLSK